MDLDSALTGKPAEGASATEVLRADHREVSRLFAEYERARDSEHASRVTAQTIAFQLELHDTIEREAFYPAVQMLAEGIVGKAMREHDEIAALVERIKSAADDRTRRDEAVAALKRAVEQHVREEEASLFPRVEQESAASLRELGRALVARKEELTRSTRAFEGPAT